MTEGTMWNVKSEQRRTAQLIADELYEIASVYRIRDFQREEATLEEGSSDGFRNLESLVKIRLGRDFDSDAWLDALALLADAGKYPIVDDVG